MRLPAIFCGLVALPFALATAAVAEQALEKPAPETAPLAQESAPQSGTAQTFQAPAENGLQSLSPSQAEDLFLNNMDTVQPYSCGSKGFQGV